MARLGSTLLPMAALVTLLATPAAASGPAPVISGVFPDHLTGTGPGKLVIMGKNFHPNAQVRIGGEPVTSSEFISSDHMEVTVQPQGPGTFTASVQNPDGMASFLSESVTVEPARKLAAPMVVPESSPAPQATPAPAPARAVAPVVQTVPVQTIPLGAPQMLVFPSTSFVASSLSAMAPDYARTAGDFMKALATGQNISSFKLSRETVILPKGGPIYAYRFLIAHRGQVGRENVVHLEGLLDSLNGGVRSWFPFWLDVSTSFPRKVVLFFRADLPTSDQGAMTTEATTHLGASVSIDRSQLLYPLPQ